MTNSKKPRRKYNSTRRQAQARETRRQIIEAAGKLFNANGYNGTTIEAIAGEAGVAPETVFAVFGNKRTILARVVDVSVGGDDQPVPLMQRAGPKAVLRESDPIQQLHLFAQDISGILERVAPVFATMRMAAKTEPEIAELLTSLLQERLHNLTRFVQQLSSHTSLRDGMDVTQGAETVWTITSPEVYSLLTVDRGWSREQYAGWLGDTLIRLLLP
ncbi:MAG: TetR/AcrR family transcriptional regulator [Anaerolineales bacterium]|nr:TetR/AcrR family transcriptional regulator [Anaerolineales bacterium]